MFTFVKRIIKRIFNKRILGSANEVELRSSLPPSSYIYVQGNNNRIIVGKHCILENLQISITGNNCILTLEEHVTIRAGKIIIHGNSAKVIISKETTIREAQIISIEDNSSVFIGEDCMFSYGIIMRTSDSHSILNAENERINKAKSIKIGNHVWLAQNITVLKGTTIGDNSVIGYGSICTGNIPANVVAVGTPTRVVKESINWSRDLL